MEDWEIEENMESTNVLKKANQEIEIKVQEKKEVKP